MAAETVSGMKESPDHHRSASLQAFGGKVFETPHSYVLARETIWSPTAGSRHPIAAPWPTKREQVYAGDKRIARSSKAHRVLPYPRAPFIELLLVGGGCWPGEIILPAHALDAVRDLTWAFLRHELENEPEVEAQVVHSEEALLGLGADLLGCLDP